MLQLYVWLNTPEEAGPYALISVAISALTTGYTSAMIAFDYDIDEPHRKVQPEFYGYIPEDNSSRGRCFVLMAIISALHNLSRSMGFALVTIAGGKSLTMTFIGVEMGSFMVYKIVRCDYFYHLRVKGVMAVVLAFLNRVIVKVSRKALRCSTRGREGASVAVVACYSRARSAFL